MDDDHFHIQIPSAHISNHNHMLVENQGCGISYGAELIAQK